MKKLTLSAANLVSTGLYISHLPRKIIKFKKNTGAGFLGTLLAFALFPLLPESASGYWIFLLSFFAVSLWAVEKTSEHYAKHDDPRIVADEMIGYWFAMAFLPRDLASMTAAFIFFRFFDTVKLWPIKKLETGFRGAFAIIIDDVAAGAEAFAMTKILLFFL